VDALPTMQAPGQQEVILRAAEVATREYRRIQRLGLEAVVQLQTARCLVAVGEDSADPLKTQGVRLKDGFKLLPVLLQNMRRKRAVLVIETIVENSHLVQQPAHMIRMLDHVGGIAGRYHDVEA